MIFPKLAQGFRPVIVKPEHGAETLPFSGKHEALKLFCINLRIGELGVKLCKVLLHPAHLQC